MGTVAIQLVFLFLVSSLEEKHGNHGGVTPGHGRRNGPVGARDRLWWRHRVCGDKLSNLLKRMGWSVSKHWLLASVWGASQKK
jgi:hypothetical protein